MLHSLLLAFFARICMACKSQDEWFLPLSSESFDSNRVTIAHSNIATHMQNRLTSIQFLQWDSNSSVAFVPEGPTLSIDCTATSLAGTHCSAKITKATFYLLKKVSCVVSYMFHENIILHPELQSK